MPAAIPTPVAVRSSSSVPPSGGAAAAAFEILRRVCGEVVRPDLYAANPFRSLGLPASVELVELVQRLATVPRDRAPGGWAFAPSEPLTAEQLMRAGRAADVGAERFVAEFFWFWPTAYPESQSDPAQAALAAGDAEAAYAHWQGGGPASAVAEHNMAVMFHYAALGRELERGPLDAEAVAWWQAAASHWAAVLAADDLWVRLEARVGLLDDPTVPSGSAAWLRTALPALLLQLPLRAAMERARRDEAREVLWLCEHARRSAADAAVLEAAVAAALAPERRQAEARLEALQERLANDSGPCLVPVTDLLRPMAGVRHVFEAVAGADSALVRQWSDRVTEIAVSALQEHLRRTGEAAAVLPWLMHLTTYPATPERRRRVTEVVDEVWQRLVAAAQVEPSNPAPNRYEAAMRVAAEVLAPAVERFSWGTRVQAAYRQRVVQRLRDLAHESQRVQADFEVASQAFALAAELSDEESSTLLVRERRQLWQQFQRAQDGALSLEHDGNRLEIDSRRLVFGGKEISVEALAGLRYGVAKGLGGYGPRVAWYAGRESVVLDAALWFDSATGGSQRYRQIVEALEACVVPALTTRIVERVRAGQSVVLGPSALRTEGLVFQRFPGQPDREVAVPYARLTQRVAAGELVVGCLDDAAVELHYVLTDVWNAVAMSEVLARLADLDTEG